MLALAASNKPCQKCGASDRNASGVCRPCQSRRSASWAEINPDKKKAQSKLSQLSLVDRKREQDAGRRKSNPGENAVRCKAWQVANPEWAAANQKKRRAADPEFKLKQNLRSRLSAAIKNGQKSGSAVRDLGCAIAELKAYLEAKFLPGMTWTNWSKTGWHIDHIRPLASFDLTDREQFLVACHYTNLQPLWAEDNMKKSDKWQPT